MSLIRRLTRQQRKQYTTIENEALQDKRLSFGARGILAYLLTKPNDWEVKTADLVNQSTAGRRAVLNMLKELEECGYLKRRRIRLENGLYDWDTEVYEVPALQPQCGLRTDVESTTYLSTEGLKANGESLSQTQVLHSCDDVEASRTHNHSKQWPSVPMFPDADDEGIHREPSRVYSTNAMIECVGFESEGIQ